MLIIDRFEGDWAVIEYGKQTFNLPRKLVPSKAKEGDVINITASIDAEGTKSRTNSIKKLAEELFED